MERDAVKATPKGGFFSGVSYLAQHRFYLLEPVVVIQFARLSIHIDCLEHGHIQEYRVST